MGASLHSLYGFNIFVARAAFSLGACCLFPQCVLAIIPLLGGVQVWRPTRAPGAHARWGQWLVPASISLCSSSAGPCLPLEPVMVVAACARPQSSCRQWPVAWVHAQGKKLLWWSCPSPRVPTPTMAPCFSGGPRLLPHKPSVATLQHFQSVSTRPTPVLSLGAWASAPSPYRGWASQAGEHGVAVLTVSTGPFCFTYCRLVTVLFFEALKLPLQVDLPTSERTSQAVVTVPPSQLPPWVTGPIPIFFSFFFSFVLPAYMEVFLPFRTSEVFCQ